MRSAQNTQEANSQLRLVSPRVTIPSYFSSLVLSGILEISSYFFVIGTVIISFHLFGIYLLYLLFVYC